MKLTYKGQKLKSLLRERVQTIHSQCRIDMTTYSNPTEIMEIALNKIDYLGMLIAGFDSEKDYEMDTEELKRICDV